MKPLLAVGTPSRGGARRTGIFLGLLAVPPSVAIGAPSVALPTIASSLHSSFGSTAWIIAAWSLGGAISMPLMGRAAQRSGVRSMLIIAAAMLTLGSVLAAVGPSLPVIVIGRLIGGLGAGGTMISLYRYVDQAFTGSERTTALVIIAACVATASGLGTLVGGSLTEFVGWRWTLAVPVLALVPLVPAARRAPSVREPNVEIDVLGASLLCVLGATLITVLQTQSTHLPVIFAVFLVGIGFLSMVALIVHMYRHPGGFVPRSVVAARGFLPAGIVGLSLGAGYYGVLTAAPHLLERGSHTSALAVGVMLLPAAVVAALTGRVLVRFTDRIAAWRTSAGLGIFSAAGSVVITAWPHSPVIVVLGVALGVIGFAGAQIVLVGLIPQLVADHDKAIAQGLFQLPALWRRIRRTRTHRRTVELPDSGRTVGHRNPGAARCGHLRRDAAGGECHSALGWFVIAGGGVLPAFVGHADPWPPLKRGRDSCYDCCSGTWQSGGRRDLGSAR